MNESKEVLHNFMFLLNKYFLEMQNHKENIFSEKFSLLNSQECTEDINWSSSDSSDIEITVKNHVNCQEQTRKRKRKRKKVLNNLSNLDVTIIDVAKDHKDETHFEKTFIVDKSGQLSPILVSTPTYFPPHKICKIEPDSPILSCAARTKSKTPLKSPILLSKTASFTVSPAIRNRLFKISQNEEKSKEKLTEVKKENICTGGDEEAKEKCILDKRKLATAKLEAKPETPKDIGTDQKISRTTHSNKIMKIPNRTVLLGDDSIDLKVELKEEIRIEDSNPDDSLTLLKPSDPELVKNIKYYFDSHFSSNSATQISITESLTPNQESRTTSDDLEISSTITQVNSKPSTPIKLESLAKSLSSMSSQSAEITIGKSKKIRYKKDGLAFRLNSLLMKQKANISLWQHERFLADNSNFLIPKGEHTSFRIQKVYSKYGCYLITAVDVHDEEFCILISNMYVENMKIATDMILKLYVPYRIVDFNSCKLIINVCKFECISFQ